MRASALLIKPPWATMVVRGHKTIELRTSRTHKIGHEIYIAKSGSKTLIGKVTITDCRPLTPQQILQLAPQHHALDYKPPPNKTIYGWFLSNPVAFAEPIPYPHPQGAQRWVRLDNIPDSSPILAPMAGSNKSN